MGRLQVVPIIDVNGCATTLSPDSATFLSKASKLATVLTDGGPLVWASTPINFHVKLYSLSLAIVSPVLGPNILSAAPVNLLCYILILWLTFTLGAEVFDRSVAMLATVALAVWPSFLLHTTQLLKDQFFIATFLLLALLMTYWLTRKFSWTVGVATGLGGGGATYLISLIRSEVWVVIVLALVLIGLALLLLRQIREKRILGGTTLSALLTLLATITILLSAPQGFHREMPAAQAPPPGTATPQILQESPPKSSSYSIAQRLTFIRHGFIIFNPSSRSNIDTETEFNGNADLVRYLPRATMIGFLAPFPRHWFVKGTQTGLAGRLLSGLEMCVIYAVEFFALIGLWRSRRSLQSWLLVLVSGTGVTALALVIINLGALYRMRYAFLIPLLIVGAHGLLSLSRKKTS